MQRRLTYQHAKSFLHSGVMVIGMFSATSGSGEVTALDRYVAAPDPSYRYELIATIRGDGYAAHVLEMTSQSWRDETEVDRPLWKHWLTVIEPEQVATGTALLIVGGGSNERRPPALVNPLLAMGAVTTRSVIASLLPDRLARCGLAADPVSPLCYDKLGNLTHHA